MVTEAKMASEMRALGIVAKFANAFAKRGGSLDMMNRIAEQPDLMQEVVNIADRQLLDRGAELVIKRQGSRTYNPAKCLTTGIHGCVVIAEIEQERLGPDEERTMPDVRLVPYVLRQDATRLQAYNEMQRRGLVNQVTVDHLWGALIGASGGQESLTVLDVKGGVNEFHLPLIEDRPFCYPLQALCTGERTWRILTPNQMSNAEVLPKGTRFILDGSANPGNGSV